MKGQKIIEYAKKLFVQTDNEGKRKHSAKFIVDAIMKKHKEGISYGTLQRWVKKYEWDKAPIVRTPTQRVAVKLTDEKVLAAIKDTGGVMSQIARNLNVDWHTADAHIRANEKFEKALLLEMEIILDGCEINLFNEAVNKKEAWAIRFLLATKGKHRGYIQGTDITSKGNQVGQSTVIILPSNGRE